MGFASRLGIFLIALTLFSSIACEEHQPGEYPEVQREQMLPEASAKSEAAPASSPTPTPVDFFPEKKSP